MLTQLIVSFSMLAAMGLSLFFSRSVPLPSCATSSFPGVVADTRIDGPLVHTRKEYLIRDGFGEEHLLARCRRSRCTGPYAILEAQERGQPAHAEWCGPYLTLVALGGVPLYTAHPPTQDKIDQDAATARLVGRACFCFLLLVGAGWGCIVARKNWRAKKMAHRSAPTDPASFN